VKRSVCLLVLVAACSHGTNKAGPTPTPTPSATASVTAAPTASPTPTVTRTPTPLVGPVGTKVPRGFVPQSATFISDTTGWVLGSSPCPASKGSCDVIARTRDGGATWKAIPSPKTSPDHLAQIRFADPANGFVTGDQLWATHDGGATWRALTASTTSTLQAAAGRAWITTERGLESAPVSTGAFVAEKSGMHINAFSVHGAQVIYAASDTDVVSTLRHGGSPVAHHTPCTDGQAIPAMGTDTHWLLVCEGEAGLGHQEKHAFETFDAGKTWGSAGDPPADTGTDVYVTTDGEFVIDHQAVAVRRAGRWSVALATQGGLSEGGFESARLGYCIGGFDSAATQMMKLTHDAGRTWRTVAF
jgi:hypothetical protein